MSEAIPHGLIFRPIDIELVDGWLTWKRPPETGPMNWVRCTDATLTQFTKLKTDGDVLKFAKRYGVLGAKELLETTPQLPNELQLPAERGRWCVSVGYSMEDKEPTWVWHTLSRQAAAILRVSAALKGRGRSPKPAVGSEEDWQTIAGSGPSFSDVEDAQFFLKHAVNDWLRIGEVGLRLGIIEWSRTKTDWKIEIGFGQGSGYNLFGHLAYRLFLVVAGEDRLYACGGCGQPYIRLKKAPRAGQDNYCPDCDGVAAKRASQRWKANKRAETGIK